MTSKMNQLFTIQGDPIPYKDHVKHPKCLGYRDELTGDYDCDYNTVLTCDQCIYGVGRRNPQAKRNQFKE